MKKRWYLVPTVIFIVCLIFARVVRTSYRDAGKADIYNYKFETGNTFNQTYQTLHTNDLNLIPQKLIDGSDIIVKGTYFGDRKVTWHGFYTPVKISKVYKGNSSYLGKQIYVLEDESAFTYTRYINTGSSAYLPLQKGDSYILLLKKVQFDASRKLDKFEESQYYPITHTAAGAYRLSNKKQTKVFCWNKKPESLNSLKGYDLPVEEKKQLDIYYQLKTSVFKKIGIAS